MWQLTDQAMMAVVDEESFEFTKQFPLQSIYGPGMPLGGYFMQIWPTADDMLCELMQNHGGGVPASLIHKLVQASEVE
ncbi:MAG: hypothetical protein WCO64_07675 [Actinomycetes bacterium]